MTNGKTIRQMALLFIQNEDTKIQTQKFDTYILDLFFRFIVEQKINPEEIRRPHIIAYKRKLIEEGKSPLTIDKYLGLVRRFYEFLESQDVCENIAKGIHSVKRYKGYQKKYLTKEQVNNIIGCIDVSSLSGKRNYALINLMVRTGLRRCEANRLNVCDIKENYLTITRKGRSYKENLGVNDSVLDPLREYISNCNLKSDDALFVSLSRRSYKKRLSMSNISSILKSMIISIIDDNKISCHSLRHTFAVNAILGGATIFDVQNALGHESAETTKIYLSMIEAQSQLNNTAHNAVSKYFDNSAKNML